MSRRGGTSHLLLRSRRAQCPPAVTDCTERWHAAQRRSGLAYRPSNARATRAQRQRNACMRISDAPVRTYAHVVCLAERREMRMVRAFFDAIVPDYRG